MNKTAHLKIVRQITKVLETEFSLWKFKFGVDPLLGFLPVIGDTLPMIISFYIVYVALLHEVPKSKIIRMVVNIFVDFIVGSIPLIGDLLDFALKPNIKNLAILEKEIKA